MYMYRVTKNCTDYTLLHVWLSLFKVENILKGSLVLIPSPSTSVKIKIMGRKVCLSCKGKTLLGLSTNFWKQKVWWHRPAMFCLITSSKLSWRWRWWYWNQAIFLIFFYFKSRKCKFVKALKHHWLSKRLTNHNSAGCILIGWNRENWCSGVPKKLP